MESGREMKPVSRYLQLLLWNLGLLALIAVPLGVAAQMITWPREYGTLSLGEAGYAWYLYAGSLLPGAVVHYVVCRGVLTLVDRLPARIVSLAASPLVLSWWFFQYFWGGAGSGFPPASLLVLPVGVILLAYGAAARVRVARRDPMGTG